MTTTTLAHNGVSVTLSDAGDIKRQCGGCTLCCRLVPVPVLRKPAGVRCRFQRFGKGCSIFYRRPASCRDWSCRWLVDPDVAARPLRRPDRSHYVIDLLPDRVGVQPTPGAEFVPVPVVQVWCDPDFPEAHRDPALRDYLADLGEREQTAALVRFKNERGLALIPPAMSTDGCWIERWSQFREGTGMWADA